MKSVKNWRVVFGTVFVVALVSFAFFPTSVAEAQLRSDQVYFQYRDGVPYYSPYYSGATVYYNGAIYPTGYPYPTTPAGYGYGYSIASALSVSCAPTDTVASIGRTVTWIASVTGGTGQYSYIWGGTDGLAGYTSSIQRAYTTPGDKFTTVTVTSGQQIITAGCTRGVRIEPFTQPAPEVVLPRVGVSCYAAQERIASGEAATWLAIVSGASATATTTYEWQGTDGLTGTGPAAFKTYPTQGLKHALLTVTSGRDRAVAACTNAVAVAPKAPPQPIVRTVTKTITEPAPLQGLCTPSHAKAAIGEEVIWNVVAIGGDGSYEFAWKGDEELSGTVATASKQYEKEGSKTASVIITSGEKSITIACVSPVEIVPKQDTGLLAAAVFSGWIDPLCLILAALLAVAIGIILALRKRRQEERLGTTNNH